MRDYFLYAIRKKCDLLLRNTQLYLRDRLGGDRLHINKNWLASFVWRREQCTATLCLSCLLTLAMLSQHVPPSRYDVVSPGEMQKLALARLFFHRPQFASMSVHVHGVILNQTCTCKLCVANIIYIYIYASLRIFPVLDEATCALSEEAEHQFYTSLRLMGVTVMSVGHRSSLRKVSKVSDAPSRLMYIPRRSGNFHQSLPTTKIKHTKISPHRFSIV